MCKCFAFVIMRRSFVLGMFQRLDRMRKHSFGSMGLFGTNNTSQIAGLWVWRGQELAFELSEDLQIDYESYKWTKLDPDSEETKKLMGNNFWPYGIEANRKALETLFRYSYEQGLAQKQLSIEELFHESTLNLLE